MIAHSKPYITPEDISCVQNILESGNIAGGEKTKLFEAEFAKHVNASTALATGSGTAALVLALKALGIESNDEVILPAYVCKNVMDAVFSVEATPVLCDIGSTWNMTAESVSEKISAETKAIIAVHIYGIPADVKAISELGISIIEDRCQYVAGNSNRNETEIAMYSFHATKLLTAGEGGMVTTNNNKIASRIKELEEQNAVASPMSDLQAALGLSQLGKYDKMLEIRKKIAKNYFQNIKAHSAMLPQAFINESIFFRFPILVENMDFEKVQAQFLAKGVHVRHGVDSLLHRTLGLSDSDFPNAVEAFNKTLSIPIYPALTESEQGQVIDAVNNILG